MEEIFRCLDATLDRGTRSRGMRPGGFAGGDDEQGFRVRRGSASGEEKTSENTSERFQGVIASYEVAQSDIDEAGGEQEVGEYRVSYIVELAESWWEGDPESLAWREPASGKTNHIEILPLEAESGLLVPGMET